MTNLFQRRPVEISASSGAYNLMYSMLNERNIYRYDVGYYGLLTAVHYDVTEYEVGSRYDRSPLTYLTIGIANKIRRAETLEKLMETPLMKKWSNLKFELNKPMLFLWFMYRIFFCVGFYLVDLGATKHTTHTVTILASR